MDEPLSDVVRRLAEYGANDHVIIATERPNAEELKRTVEVERVRLMVIDTATEFAAGIVDDLNAAARWQPLLRDLPEISQQTGTATGAKSPRHAIYRAESFSNPA